MYSLPSVQSLYQAFVCMPLHKVKWREVEGCKGLPGVINSLLRMSVAVAEVEMPSCEAKRVAASRMCQSANMILRETQRTAEMKRGGGGVVVELLKGFLAA